MRITRKQAENIASVLSEGLPYIRKFNNKIIVVKYGGAAMTKKSLQDSFARDITLMKLVGMNPVIVHGGGPQIGKELKKAGIHSKFIEGHRITTRSSMKVVKKVLGEKYSDEFNHRKAIILKEYAGSVLEKKDKRFCHCEVNHFVSGALCSASRV